LFHEGNGVQKDIVSEIDAAGVQRRHLRSGLQGTEAILLRIADGAAGGHLENGIRLLANEPNHLPKNLLIAGGFSFWVTDVKVQEGGAGLDRLKARPGDLLE